MLFCFGFVRGDLEEIYGEHLGVLEILKRIDEDWLASSGVTLPFLRQGGKEWAILRHHLNDRGDKSSVQARKTSVERIGVVNAARSGALAFSAAKREGVGGMNGMVPCVFPLAIACSVGAAVSARCLRRRGSRPDRDRPLVGGALGYAIRRSRQQRE